MTGPEGNSIFFKAKLVLPPEYAPLHELDSFLRPLGVVLHEGQLGVGLQEGATVKSEFSPHKTESYFSEVTAA